MGDLIGFKGYLNESAPFWSWEHEVEWKSDRRYADWGIGTNYNATCQFPRFWNETGYPVDPSVNQQFVGCYDGEFDQASTPHDRPNTEGSPQCVQSRGSWTNAEYLLLVW
jgi:hypothetical protein